MDEVAALIDPMGPVPEDAVWLDAAGIDATGIDATGIDATGIDATGIDATGIDAAAIDAAGPEAQLEASTARVEQFAAASARAMAAQLAAIDDTLRLAGEHPDLFAGPHCKPGKETIEFARRAAMCDIALQLAVSESTVQTWAATARTLRESLPGVHDLFRNGLIGYPKVCLLVDAATTLPTDEGVLARFDQTMAGVAVKLTPSKLRRKARATVEKLHPVSMQERHERAVQERRFYVDPDVNGMAWLGAYLAADTAIRAQERIEANARALAGLPGEERTLAQLRADTLADLLTGDGTPGEVRAMVSVTIPMLTLLGEDTPDGYRSDPAILTGYGPIDAQTARRLCRNAPSLFRLLTDPIDGARLTVDRKSYRPPADLKRLVHALQPTCTFPGCNRVAERSDLDHTQDWALDGHTAVRNLAPLCRHHHRVKHLTRWTMTRHPDTGEISWRSPTGTTHNADPPPY